MTYSNQHKTHEQYEAYIRLLSEGAINDEMRDRIKLIIEPQSDPSFYTQTDMIHLASLHNCHVFTISNEQYIKCIDCLQYMVIQNLFKAVKYGNRWHYITRLACLSLMV